MHKWRDTGPLSLNNDEDWQMGSSSSSPHGWVSLNEDKASLVCMACSEVRSECWARASSICFLTTTCRLVNPAEVVEMMHIESESNVMNIRASSTERSGRWATSNNAMMP